MKRISCVCVCAWLLGSLVRGLVDKELSDEMQTVAVWKRGWGRQQQEGLLLASKLDYLQQTAARNFIRWGALKGCQAIVKELIF
jgi:hypothetical protein